MGNSYKLYITSKAYASGGYLYFNNGYRALTRGNASLALARTVKDTVPRVATNYREYFVVASDNALVGLTGANRVAKTYRYSYIFMSNNYTFYDTSKTSPSTYNISPSVSITTLTRIYYGNSMSLDGTDITFRRNFFTYTTTNNVRGTIYIPASDGCIRFINVFGIESKEYGWITLGTMISYLNSYPTYAYKSPGSQVYTCVKGAQGWWGTQTLCGCAMTSSACYIHASNLWELKVTVITLSIN